MLTHSGASASVSNQRALAAWHPAWPWRCTCLHSQHAPRNSARPKLAAMASATSSSNQRPDGEAAQARPVVALPPPSSTMYAEGQFVEVGTVAGAFGIRGEVRVEISTDNPRKRFGLPGKRIFLRPPPASGLLARMQGAQNQGMLELTTASAKFQVLSKGEQAWIVQFRELTDRSQAEQLMQYTMHIPMQDRERLRDPDEFWVQDLVGCRAFLKGSSAYVGRVVDVISGTGTHDTLILQLLLNKDDIRNSRNRQCMIPFAKAICPEIDRTLKQLVIDPPEGLLDMFSYKPMRKKLTEEQQAERMLLLENTSLPVLGQPNQQPATATANPSQDKVAASPSQPNPALKLSARRRQAEFIAARDREALASEPRRQPWGLAPAHVAQTSPVQAQGQRQQEQQQQEEEVGVEEEEEQEQEEEEVSGSDGDEGQEGGEARAKVLTATDKWKLRRKLGVSLASRPRRR